MIINIQDDILRLDALGLLDRLLQDKATKGNILWATDAYSHLGDWYTPGNEIRSQRITGENSDLIKTRARRAMEQRTERTRQHAEVFTPLWVVKKMCDVADEQWFGRKDGFYKLTDEGKIAFTNRKKHWKLYVDARRLEITCGEAPFLVTRYDVETGEALPAEERIGLLDRKLRVVSENAADIEEWKTWALRAVQSTYGFELQGDNLLIARVNVLCSVEEHMAHRWRQKPEKDWLERACNVICWNLWQMDGIKGCVPVPPKPTEEQISLFPLEPRFEQENLFGDKKEAEIGCRLFDWRNDRSRSYQALREKGPELMKFDFIIGNPPYQEEQEGDNKTYAPKIYHLFLDESYKISDKVELIHPARFLFNAGSTPKAWNKKMLVDPHFKVLFHEQNSAKVFSNTDIKGGIAITYHDNRKTFGAIETFTPFEELNNIKRKVESHEGFSTMSAMVITAYAYHFTQKMHDDFPSAILRLSSGHAYDLKSNVFEKLPDIFVDSPYDDSIFVRVIGLLNSKRVYKYIKREYLETPKNFEKYKVIMPAANGSGALGEVMSTPLIGEPLIGETETFISIGSLETYKEAEALLKYVKTKFCRVMLGILKVTQHITPEKWKYVPLQDFTSMSDIDWNQSIADIDVQLYRKYGLDEAEITFIETHVKEMS